MSDKYHTEFVDGTTEYKAADMGAPLGELDQAIDDLHGFKKYDFMGQYLGSTLNSAALMMRGVISRYVALKANAPDSEMYVGTPPTDGPATFIIRRNGSNVGTILVNPGHNRGAFTVASDVAFYHGDVIELLAPNPADASLQDVSWSIVLTRPDQDDMSSTSTTTETSTSTTSTSTTTTV